MNRQALAARLADAERELRAAQDAVRREKPGAHERYARARAALDAVTAAAEQELLSASPTTGRG